MLNIIIICSYYCKLCKKKMRKFKSLFPIFSILLLYCILLLNSKCMFLYNYTCDKKIFRHHNEKKQKYIHTNWLQIISVRKYNLQIFKSILYTNIVKNNEILHCNYLLVSTYFINFI